MRLNRLVHVSGETKWVKPNFPNTTFPYFSNIYWSSYSVSFTCPPSCTGDSPGGGGNRPMPRWRRQRHARWRQTHQLRLGRCGLRVRQFLCGFERIFHVEVKIFVDALRNPIETKGDWESQVHKCILWAWRNDKCAIVLKQKRKRRFQALFRLKDREKPVGGNSSLAKFIECKKELFRISFVELRRSCH